MSYKFREEVVGKRFLCVRSASKLKVSKIQDWEWRAGVVRAATTKDKNNPDLSVRQVKPPRQASESREMSDQLIIGEDDMGLADPFAITVELFKNQKILVEFDDRDWTRREWIKLHENIFQIFLVESCLVWASRAEPVKPRTKTNLPCLSFTSYVVDDANIKTSKLQPIEFIHDRHVEFVSADTEFKPFKEEELSHPILSTNAEVRLSVRNWVEEQNCQKILLTTPSVLVGYRLRVYRAEGTTQWYTAVIKSYNDTTRELLLVDDTVLEEHCEDPLTIQMRLIGDGLVDSILKGVDVGIAPRRRSYYNRDASASVKLTRTTAPVHETKSQSAKSTVRKVTKAKPKEVKLAVAKDVPKTSRPEELETKEPTRNSGKRKLKPPSKRSTPGAPELPPDPGITPTDPPHQPELRQDPPITSEQNVKTFNVPNSRLDSDDSLKKKRKKKRKRDKDLDQCVADVVSSLHYDSVSSVTSSSPEKDRTCSTVLAVIEDVVSGNTEISTPPVTPRPHHGPPKQHASLSSIEETIESVAASSNLTNLSLLSEVSVTHQVLNERKRIERLQEKKVERQQRKRERRHHDQCQRPEENGLVDLPSFDRGDHSESPRLASTSSVEEEMHFKKHLLLSDNKEKQVQDCLSAAINVQHSVTDQIAKLAKSEKYQENEDRSSSRHSDGASSSSSLVVSKSESVEVYRDPELLRKEDVHHITSLQHSAIQPIPRSGQTSQTSPTVAFPTTTMSAHQTLNTHAQSRGTLLTPLHYGISPAQLQQAQMEHAAVLAARGLHPQQHMPFTTLQQQPLYYGVHGNVSLGQLEHLWQQKHPTIPVPPPWMLAQSSDELLRDVNLLREREMVERERIERQRLEQERSDRERKEKVQHEREQRERDDRLNRERAELDRQEQERKERDRQDRERHEREQRERAERHRVLTESAAAIAVNQHFTESLRIAKQKASGMWTPGSMAPRHPGQQLPATSEAQRPGSSHHTQPMYASHANRSNQQPQPEKKEAKEESKDGEPRPSSGSYSKLFETQQELLLKQTEEKRRLTLQQEQMIKSMQLQHETQQKFLQQQQQQMYEKELLQSSTVASSLPLYYRGTPVVSMAKQEPNFNIYNYQAYPQMYISPDKIPHTVHAEKMKREEERRVPTSSSGEKLSPPVARDEKRPVEKEKKKQMPHFTPAPMLEKRPGSSHYVSPRPAHTDNQPLDFTRHKIARPSSPLHVASPQQLSAAMLQPMELKVSTTVAGKTQTYNYPQKTESRTDVRTTMTYVPPRAGSPPIKRSKPDTPPLKKKTPPPVSPTVSPTSLSVVMTTTSSPPVLTSSSLPGTAATTPVSMVTRPNSTPGTMASTAGITSTSASTTSPDGGYIDSFKSFVENTVQSVFEEKKQFSSMSRHPKTKLKQLAQQAQTAAASLAPQAQPVQPVALIKPGSPSTAEGSNHFNSSSSSSSSSLMETINRVANGLVDTDSDTLSAPSPPPRTGEKPCHPKNLKKAWLQRHSDEDKLTEQIKTEPEEKPDDKPSTVKDCYVNCSYISPTKEGEAKSPISALIQSSKDEDISTTSASETESGDVQKRLQRKRHRRNKRSKGEKESKRKRTDEPRSELNEVVVVKQEVTMEDENSNTSKISECSNASTSNVANCSSTVVPPSTVVNAAAAAASTTNAAPSTAASNGTSVVPPKKQKGKRLKEEVKSEPCQSTVQQGQSVSSAAAAKPLVKHSLAQLKKSMSPFLQDGPCTEVTPKLMKCRECKMTPAQSNEKIPNIFCRFYAFRRIRYNKNGHLGTAGFSEPGEADPEDVALWQPNYEHLNPPMSVEVARYVIGHVGDKFCQLVEQENEAKPSEGNSQIAWKRAVQGVREMCDVCDTTLFNMHWCCHKCGFVVCLDCYRNASDPDGAASNGDVNNDDARSCDSPNREDHQWLTCSANRQPHEPSKMMLTQIIPSSVLWEVGRLVHEVRDRWGIKSRCACRKNQKSLKNGLSHGRLVNGDLGHRRKNKHKTTTACSDISNYPPKNNTLAYTSETASPLSILADVASLDSEKVADKRVLQKAIDKLNGTEEGVEDTSQDSNGDKKACSTLRELLTKNAGGKLKAENKKNNKPKAINSTLDDIIQSVVERSLPKDNVHHPDGPPVVKLCHYVPKNGCVLQGRQEPIRIHTLTETSVLYPDVPHSWLCDGRLLRLHDSKHRGNLDIFQEQWKRGQPVLVSGCDRYADRNLWNPEAFSKEFGHLENDLVNCQNGTVLVGNKMRFFWDGFERLEKRLTDEEGEPMLLKLKDWPPTEDFSDLLPSRFHDLMKSLPLPEYTHRTGILNLASRLPDFFVKPDLGPKMYNAYGSSYFPREGTTNLHLDVSDAVNLMVYVGVPNDNDRGIDHEAAALKAIDEAGCDILTRRRVREVHEKPGALWHIFDAQDADKIRDLLNKVGKEQGDEIEAHHDAIHDQSWYLDVDLRKRLKEEYDVEGYTIVQCLGDAVFIPAGAPHQVRNLHSCIKVAEDFVSPEHLHHCFRLTHEFRHLSDTHTNHEDKLQVKNIIYHAVKDSVAVLHHEQPNEQDDED